MRRPLGDAPRGEDREEHAPDERGPSRDRAGQRQVREHEMQDGAGGGREQAAAQQEEPEHHQEVAAGDGYLVGAADVDEPADGRGQAQCEHGHGLEADGDPADEASGEHAEGAPARRGSPRCRRAAWRGSETARRRGGCGTAGTAAAPAPVRSTSRPCRRRTTGRADRRPAGTPRWPRDRTGRRARPVPGARSPAGRADPGGRHRPAGSGSRLAQPPAQGSCRSSSPTGRRSRAPARRRRRVRAAAPTAARSSSTADRRPARGATRWTVSWPSVPGDVTLGRHGDGRSDRRGRAAPGSRTAASRPRSAPSQGVRR